MNRSQRLLVAIQKSGRLHERSMELLRGCGVEVERRRSALVARCRDFPLDLLLARDDDIPAYVRDGVCHLGIVGENMLVEKLDGDAGERPEVLARLGFGHCRLALAVPKNNGARGLVDLEGTRIATSYPNTVRAYLRERDVDATVVEIGGAVEVTPALGVADSVCDLVSSGATLQSNGLREVETLLSSEAVLVRAPGELDAPLNDALERLLTRVRGVLRAARSKYIMMNAPVSAVPAIREILPGLESPTVLPLPGVRAAGGEEMVAVHAVALEEVFWETMELLKGARASSILVVPIEKIIQ